MLDAACQKAVPLSAVIGTPVVVERRGSDLASGSSDARWLRICRPAVSLHTAIRCMRA